MRLKKTWILAGILFVLAILCSLLFSALRRQSAMIELAKQEREISGKNTVLQKPAGESAAEKETERQTKESKKIEAGALDSVKTTAETQYCVEIYKENTGELQTGSYRLPTELVGKTREEISDLLKTFEQLPGEEELQKGFVHAELLAFSDKKIVIRKNYLTESDEFLLLPSEGKIVVYQNDGRTIYTITDISLDRLGEEQKREIEQGKKIHSLSELYDFLEAFSS